MQAIAISNVVIPQNIIFYFPYAKGAAGVNVLFLMLADHLANSTPYNIAIGDYEHGYMVSHNRNSRLGELRLNVNKPLVVPLDSAIVFQTLPPWYISDELQIPDDTKILFWNLHPYNLLMYFKQRSNHPLYYKFGSKYVKHLMKRFASVLLEYDGLIFMDGENRRSAETILQTRIENPVYVPVASGPAQRIPLRFSNRLAWLGRLADFKVSILKYTIGKLAEYSSKKKFDIEFHIIGDGPDRNEVEKFARDLESPHFKVVLDGEIEQTNLGSFLQSNASVLFAMGASALEGARIGIPTILMDFSYRHIQRDIGYRYLFETEQFNLGSEIDNEGYKDGAHSIGEIIDELSNPEAYQRISDCCYQYYIHNHDIEAVSRELLIAIERCRLRYSVVKPLRENFIMRTFKAVTGARQF